VVDPQLRVRGVEGLSIADGSIFPSMPTVNPMVTTFMIGERAADLVRGRTR
jgi:choline dehydrogenase